MVSEKLLLVFLEEVREHFLDLSPKISHIHGTCTRQRHTTKSTLPQSLHCQDAKGPISLRLLAQEANDTSAVVRFAALAVLLKTLLLLNFPIRSRFDSTPGRFLERPRSIHESVITLRSNFVFLTNRAS